MLRVTQNTVYWQSLGGISFLVAIVLMGGQVGATDTRFCVVPVQDGHPTERDIGKTSRLLSTVFQIPGLPAPVLTPANRKGQWTINSNRKLVPYDTPFPHSFLDRRSWVLEPWSRRVVGVSFRDRQVSVVRPASEKFELVKAPPTIKFISVATLPRRRITIATSKAGPFIVGSESLQPWTLPLRLGLDGVHSVWDMPSLAATLIRDNSNQLHVLDDDHRLVQIGDIDKKDYGNIFDDPKLGAAIFMGGRTVLAIKRTEGVRAFTSTVLTRKSGGASVSLDFFKSKFFGQLITYDSGGWFDSDKRLRRFTSNGFQDIPGGTIQFAYPRIGIRGALMDLPTLGAILIKSASGLRLYDGEKIVAVPDSSPERLGAFVSVHDLKSIGRVLVRSQRHLFELTPQGKLISLDLPFRMSTSLYSGIFDWVASKVALFNSMSGLYAVNSDLKAVAIAGGEAVGSSYPGAPGAVTMPGTGELLLPGKRGLFLAIDRLKNRDGACDTERARREPFPRSSLCLRPITASSLSAIGEGVSTGAEFPDGHGVLLASRNGLFRLNSDDTLHNVSPRGEKPVPRSFYPLPVAR